MYAILQTLQNETPLGEVIGLVKFRGVVIRSKSRTEIEGLTVLCQRANKLRTAIMKSTDESVSIPPYLLMDFIPDCNFETIPYKESK